MALISQITQMNTVRVAGPIHAVCEISDICVRFGLGEMPGLSIGTIAIPRLAALARNDKPSLGTTNSLPAAP